MIPPVADRKTRPCYECIFWNFQDSYCWIGMDTKNRPYEGSDKLAIGVGDTVEHVFTCSYHHTPDEVKEIIDSLSS